MITVLENGQNHKQENHCEYILGGRVWNIYNRWVAAAVMSEQKEEEGEEEEEAESEKQFSI